MKLRSALLALPLYVGFAHAQIILTPGTSIQSAVNSYPNNTAFILSPGTYRQQSVVPKNGDSFIGQAGAVMNGSMLLSSWQASNSLYVAASGYTTPGQQNGPCDSMHPLCAMPEDLFMDDRPLARVAYPCTSLATGQWCLDYSTGNVWMFDNPVGHTMELGVIRNAFSGQNVSNVTIKGLKIEKYAVPGQFGAIGDQYPGTFWNIIDNEIRLNHGTGVNVQSGSIVVNNKIHDNGEKGGGAGGANILITDNQIYNNNWAGFNCGWECGGFKAAQVSYYTVTNNQVYDNNGPGLWTDVDSIYVVYDGNQVYNNTQGAGIMHEISYDALISNNTSCGNGIPGISGWPWAAQVLLSTSQNVTVQNNSLVVSAQTNYGNGIGVIQQNRGAGAFGTYVAKNVLIRNNDITHLQSPQGVSGTVADYNQPAMLASANNIRWDYDHWHVQDPGTNHYILWGSGNYLSVAQFQTTAGQELHGTMDSTINPCAVP